MKKFLFTLAVMLCATLNVLAVDPSGTLPILYINIDKGEEVVEKEKYLNAVYWLDPKGCEGIDAIGSESEPLATKIKGRGNYTFTSFDKKPYRLKLDKKQKFLGMESSKHFGLLAHADDNVSFLRNTIGFRLSELLGLPWTPAYRPVEVVINGTYRGLYFATELVRIDKKRVNITEWQEEDADGNELEKWVQGGSLVELDNYPGDAQVEFKDGSNWDMRITYDKSVDPGYEPDGYKDWLLNEFKEMDRIIFGDKNSDEIWNHLDLDDCARYMLVQDITHNSESMHGSCYMYKDLGENQKWHYSPVWDFGSIFWGAHAKEHFWQGTHYCNHWAEELYKFPKLKQRMAELWTELQAEKFATLDEYATDFIAQIKAAAAKDYERWPNYGNNDLDNDLKYVIEFLHSAKDWLNLEFDVKVELKPTPFVVPEDEDCVYHVFFRQDGAATNWEKVMIYWWGDHLFDYRDWPGRNCDYVSIDGKNYWHYKITSDAEGDEYPLIFNNGDTGGDNQTANLIVRKRGVYTIGMKKDTYPSEYLPVGSGLVGIECITDTSADQLIVKTTKGAIIVETESAKTLDIVSIDGTTQRVNVAAGTNRIELPQGLYIINGKKYML